MQECLVSGVSNTTSDVSIALKSNLTVLKFIFNMINCIEGVLMVGGGFAIALSILSHAGLRACKEKLLIMGVTLFPAFEGFAYISSAVYRIPLLYAGRDRLPTTKWFCWLLPFNQLWLMFPTPQSLAMCAMSIDRLMLILNPLAYLKQPVSYGWMWIGGCYAHGLIVYLISMVQALQSVDRCDEGAIMFCYVSMAREQTLSTHALNVTSFGALLSVIIFGAALLLYRRHKRKVAATSTSQTQAQQLKDQRKMTINFAISTACTLLLYVIPIALYTLFEIDSRFYAICGCKHIVIDAIFIVANLNPILNIFIFLRRDKEIRIGLWAALKCKTMPYNVKLWT